MIQIMLTPKRIFSTAILLSVAFFNVCYSQVDTSYGIGRLRLNKTYSQILNDLNLIDKNIRLKSELEEVDEFSITYKSVPNARDVFQKCPESFILHIPEYNISGILIRSIDLSFYRDTLYEVKTDFPVDPKVETILDSKYGKNVLSSSEKINYCKLSTGDKLPMRDKSYMRKWNSGNDNIMISSILMETRDEKTCDLNSRYSFTYTNRSMFRRFWACGQSVLQSKDQQKKVDSEKLLKEF